MVITLQGPYDLPRSIRFWRRSTGELCEQWHDGVYRRIIELNQQPRLLELTPVGTIEAPAVAIHLDQQPATPAETLVLEPLARHLLGDSCSLVAFMADIRHDPAIYQLTQQLYGLRPTRSPLWETLIWTICGQQISVAFAYVLKERLVSRYGSPYQVAGRTLYHFPTPAQLAQLTHHDLTPLQFSRQKARYVIELAQQIEAGTLDLALVEHHATPQAIDYLIQFLGIGRWTAEFLLLRALGRPDAFPANDAGVRQAVTHLYGARLLEPELRTFSQRWGDWRGMVALYLLASLRDDEEI